MPLCIVYTNMKRKELGDHFEERLAQCIADVCQVPSEGVYITLHSELPTYFGGCRDPTMWCKIHAKNTFRETANLQEYYSKFFKTLRETTNLPGNRTIVELIDVGEEYAKLGS